MATLSETPPHNFEQKVEYEEAKLQALNLEEGDQPKEIWIGDD